MNKIKILDLESYSDESSDEAPEKLEDSKTLPWIEKYRPITLNDVISQSNITSVLKTFIKTQCFPHLLFYGKSGVGKTSTITACAKQLYGDQYPYMVLELNASDDRGIEVVRNRIITFATSKSIFLGQRSSAFKLVILDETDAMTHDAQAILRNVVENCTVNTRFCLICNYIKNINPALQSRCTKFRFAPLKLEDIKKKVMYIARNEHITVTDTGITTLVKRSKGDMRKVLNVLQSTSMIYKKVTEETVNSCIGYPQKDQIKIIFESLVKDTFLDTFNKISTIKNDTGLSLNDILNELHDIIVESIIKEDSIDTLDEKKIIQILDRIRDIEFNQSSNSTESIQLGALIGIFKM
jgi:replication factor C subunit 3/5